MTPLEKYNSHIKSIRLLCKKQEDIAKEKLKEDQKTCEHKFGELHQIGWVPDIEIMGYTCELCGVTKRE